MKTGERNYRGEPRWERRGLTAAAATPKVLRSRGEAATAATLQRSCKPGKLVRLKALGRKVYWVRCNKTFSFV